MASITTAGIGAYVADRQEKGYANSNTTKNREGRTFRYANITEVRAAIEGLWLRHEALKKADILTPLVFWQQKGQRIVRFWKR